jgi:hypothetical protein
MLLVDGVVDYCEGGLRWIGQLSRISVVMLLKWLVVLGKGGEI